MLQLHACRWIFGAFPFCPERRSDFSISSELEDKVLCQLFRKPVEEGQKWVLIHYKKYVSWKNAVSHSWSTKYITDHNHLLLLIQISCMMLHLWLLGAGNTANKTVRERVWSTDSTISSENCCRAMPSVCYTFAKLRLANAGCNRSQWETTLSLSLKNYSRIFFCYHNALYMSATALRRLNKTAQEN